MLDRNPRKTKPKAVAPTWSIDRLRRIKPGEVVVYYRGRLPNGSDPPAYARIVSAICEEAAKLEVAGRVYLRSNQLPHRGRAEESPFNEFEFFAIGRG
jgi:hypothetical protein